jgi:hypothetical protein
MPWSNPWGGGSGGDGGSYDPLGTAAATVAAHVAAPDPHPSYATDADLSGKEPALGNPDTDGKVLSSTAAGVRSWIDAADGASGSSTQSAESVILRTALFGGF